MPMLLSLDLFQALIFLIRFELTHRMIVRAWMTVGLAVRLANILRLHLHNPDTEGSHRVHRGLPPTTDPLSIEMRRRSLWSLYVCETYASARAGMSPLLQEDQVTIPLPCPGNLDSDFTPVAMPTLAESYSPSMTDSTRRNFSSFTGIVLACAVARRCQPHAELVSGQASTTPTPQAPLSSSTTGSAGGFWDRHFALLTVLEDRTKLLVPHLTVRAVKTDPVAFSLYVYLCGIDISLQEVALAQVEREGFASAVAADSAQRSRSAAYRLAGIAWATSPRDRHCVRPRHPHPVSFDLFLFFPSHFISQLTAIFLPKARLFCLARCIYGTPCGCRSTGSRARSATPPRRIYDKHSCGFYSFIIGRIRPTRRVDRVLARVSGSDCESRTRVG